MQAHTHAQQVSAHAIRTQARKNAHTKAHTHTHNVSSKMSRGEEEEALLTIDDIFTYIEEIPTDTSKEIFYAMDALDEDG